MLFKQIISKLVNLPSLNLYPLKKVSNEEILWYCVFLFPDLDNPTNSDIISSRGTKIFFELFQVVNKFSLVMLLFVDSALWLWMIIFYRWW